MTFPFFLLTLLSAAFAYGLFRRHPRRKTLLRSRKDSPVSRQHWQLYQGGWINRHAVQQAKHDLLQKLHQQDVDTVSRKLEGGPDFLLQVRALADAVFVIDHAWPVEPHAD